MFSTQSSSKARLKKDTIGEAGLLALYKAYEELNAHAFREYCIQLVKSGGGNQPTKDAIIASLDATIRKDVMLTKTNNFCFAGMGLGV